MESETRMTNVNSLTETLIEVIGLNSLTLCKTMYAALHEICILLSAMMFSCCRLMQRLYF